MATNTNVEWVLNAKLFAEKYYQAVIDNDPSFLNDDPNTQSVLVSLNDLRTRIRCAIEIGDLKVRGRHSQIYMQPSQDAFNTGIVKLQDFCDWAETIGLDDCPKTANELALFFKMPKAIEIANSIDTQAPENETSEQGKTVVKRFKAPENHRVKVSREVIKLGRSDGTRPHDLKAARALKAKARESLVKGGFTENNFEAGWKQLPKDNSLT
jgi:hypothetical protein